MFSTIAYSLWIKRETELHRSQGLQVDARCVSHGESYETECCGCCTCYSDPSLHDPTQYAMLSFSVPNPNPVATAGTQSVACPAGKTAGSVLQIEHEGQAIQVTVPAGVSPGQSFAVALREASSHLKVTREFVITKPHLKIPSGSVVKVSYLSADPKMFIIVR